MAEYEAIISTDDNLNVDVSTDIDVPVTVTDNGFVSMSVEPDATTLLLDAEVQPDEIIDVPVQEGLGGIASDHRLLLHRDANNQHPMSAITGLNDTLSNIQSTLETRILDAENEITDLSLVEEADRITMANAVIRIDRSIDLLQNQVDGNITTWFYDYVPTLGNSPASDWIQAGEEAVHLGDLFYNTNTGYVYRWMSDGATPPAYSWTRITDSDVTKALADAAAAQDTADHKRRVFIATPTVPYDAGDLWFVGISGDILTCTQGKLESEYYDAGDWSKLHKYTDDTRANEAYTLANNAKLSADGKNRIFRQNSQPTGGVYGAGDVWFDTAHDNKIYRYDGASWVAVSLGNDALDNLSANKITAGTLDASQVTVSNLDAGNITTGMLDASHIDASTLTIGGIGLATTQDVESFSSAKQISTYARSFTKATWDAYGASGHSDSWVASGYDNSHISVGDIAYVNGSVSDKAGWYAAIIGTVTSVTASAVVMTSIKVAYNSTQTEKFVTKINDAGIRIHPSSTENNSVVINADGMEVFKGGTASANSVAFYGDTARIGKENANHINVTSSALEYWGDSGTSRYARFGGWMQIGSDDAIHLKSDSSGLSYTGNNGRNIFDVHLTGTTSQHRFTETFNATSAALVGAPTSGQTIYVRCSDSLGSATQNTFTAGTDGTYTYSKGSANYTVTYTASTQTITISGSNTPRIRWVSYSTAVPNMYTTLGVRAFADDETDASMTAGDFSLTQGLECKASAEAATALNYWTRADSAYQTVVGKYNSADESDTYGFIVGNGTSKSSRANALAVGWDGDLRLNGDVYVGCNDDSTGGTLLPTRAEVDVLNNFFTKASVGTTGTTFNLPNNYRGTMYIYDSSATNNGMYMVYATGSGGVSYKAVSTASNITLTDATNKLTVTPTNGGSRVVLFINAQNVATV